MKKKFAFIAFIAFNMIFFSYPFYDIPYGTVRHKIYYSNNFFKMTKLNKESRTVPYHTKLVFGLFFCLSHRCHEKCIEIRTKQNGIMSLLP